ncbi:MAG: sel1 repeat family protein, partial [Candidatus Methanomethylophilus sp.]|nr:sel1 repeat family protein [Methanomethylophilus sp.]
NLGDMYEKGRGVPQDFDKAFEYYTRSYNLGNDLALCSLGDMYLLGEGVPKDRAKAVEIYTESARKGCEEAAEELRKLGEPVPETDRE